MLLIYHFESHPEFGHLAGRVLQAVEEGRCRLIVSVLARMEVLVVPKRHGRDDLCREYRHFFEGFPHLRVPVIDERIVEIASDLRARGSLRTPDALHLATARANGASAFLTEDTRIKSTPELAVLRLEEAVQRLDRIGDP